MESQQDPVTVDYAVIGDLDLCTNVSCNYFAVCKAFGPKDARCICVDNCPSYEEPVCSSNGPTYDNECSFQKEMCHLKANFTIYHPGFPSQKGRDRLRHHPSWAEAVCEQVPLVPYVFYPDKPVHVQVSVNHVNFSDPSYVHEAAVAWVEDIRENNFTVCVTQAGRNKKNNRKTFATVDWLAYQGAPDGGLSGDMDMSTWWTGTSCRTISLPPNRSVKKDIAIESETDWMAFEELHEPLFMEHGSLYFANGIKPSKEFNYAFCKDVVFKKPYNDSPAILSINKTGYRACVKELFVNQHDPLSVSYAVMPDVCEPGWRFYNGSCYYTSDTCETWSNASTICRGMGANLPAIESQEENVYIQHRHNGDKAWIGVNDIATEGLFTWVDGCPDKFRYWAEGQPNDFQGEDCVHSLEFDECFNSPCLNGGTCTDWINNYTCSCPPPYFGRQCQAVVRTSCKTLLVAGFTSSGSYSLKINGYSFQVYCDMTGNSGGWTFIARFSNTDRNNWMRDDAYWWYDILSSQGSPTSTSTNSDMVSEAFWNVKGSEIKITRSDDSSHSALLRTYTNCFGGETFRGYMSSYGRFSYRNAWSNDQCLGSCPVHYDGSYQFTIGFSQAHCGSNIQGSYRIGFWCQWSTGDGSVLMFGGGGSGCGRADHGIGITENNYGGFEEWSDSGEYDFGGNRLTIVSALELQRRLTLLLHLGPAVGQSLVQDGKINFTAYYPDLLYCTNVQFPRAFSSSRNVRVITSISYESNTGSVHDSAVVWTSDVAQSSFRVCVLESGPGTNGSAVVNWIAFRSAPSGILDGTASLSAFTSGTKCERVTFAQDWLAFTHSGVQLTFQGKLLFENGGAPREQDNFAFCKDWMAFEELHQPLFMEHGSLYFTNGKKPSKEFNYAFCEYINKTGFRACVKELFVNQHDPLSVSYAVMPDACEPGWSFYNGSCYYTSDTCKTWSKANRICRGMGANLPAIESQEENVYIQHRHHGDRAWIGLNDIATEGLFSWVDGCPDKFRYWAESQPNDFRGEDCVHSLGPSHGYMWNDVDCSTCHQYTCKKEFEECSSNRCLNGGTCTDGINNYTCSCPSPFFGRRCQETDECKSNPCLNGGTCVDGVYNFTCVCPSLYHGRRCEAVARTSCKNLLAAGYASSGSYSLKVNRNSFQVYCDMTGSSGGWTLIARFSNADGKNWMRDDAYWWYDILSSRGSPISTSTNSDMISEAFWEVKGSEIKITRSDDSSHSALLRTYTNCFGGKTFRGYMSSYGKFSYRNVWSNNRCLGSCPVHYGGSYQSTIGFSQALCNGNIQGSHRIGFWCQWDGGDGSVLMFGGGGSGCGRADHGIGITENDYGGFEEWSHSGEIDFGDEANNHNSPTTSYAFNLWIR
ncbi:C-type lectin domain family 4 member M [Stylophora pistillata]|uniref:C-type lectin domain family 4 member M n=1 Tax=Stylophora pistillata TaxID=50429 RepID=A0A2B4R980_STYPI|nr:C-type lectin domain family 4 member M [Stylophora pistillata]